jgi:hypothetical protein
MSSTALISRRDAAGSPAAAHARARRGELLQDAAGARRSRSLLFDRAHAAKEVRARMAVALDDAKERVHDARMELRPAAAQQLGACELDRLRLLVRAAAHDHFERVRRGDDVRLHRDVVACEPLRIAVSVIALVVRANDRDEVAQRLDRGEDRCADGRVRAHEHPFVLRERAGLVEDGVRDADLADVVQRRAQLHGAARRVETHLLGDGAGEGPPRAPVAACVRIARVDRGREGLHRREYSSRICCVLGVLERGRDGFASDCSTPLSSSSKASVV